MAYGTLAPYRRGALARSGGGFGTGSLVFDLHRQMNRMFEDLFEPDGGSGGSSATAGFPPMEITQDDKKVEVCAELPGVKREDIDLTVEDGVLMLSGEKKSERRDENGYSERSYGRFERRITLPSNIDQDACQADFTDGVLKITIPRSEAKARGRRIELGTSEQQSGSAAESALIDQNKPAAGNAGQSAEGTASQSTGQSTEKA